MSLHYKVQPVGTVNTYSTVTTRKLKTHEIHSVCKIVGFIMIEGEVNIITTLQYMVLTDISK
jgi:hypothetical protein